MLPFRYLRPDSPAHAAQLLAEPGAVALGGGTDLLVTLHEGLAHPDTLVDLRRVPHARAIVATDDGGVRLGGGARIADIAEHPLIAESFAALAQACRSVGTVQLRNMGTIGGNLCQRPRCWYFRRGLSCFKSGGSSCPAVHGENQYLGVLGGGPCHAPHPSDPAVALTALDARVVIAGATGERTVPMAAFYDAPDITRDTVVGDGEFVRAIEIPGASGGGAQRYDKVMQRGAWDFALVSLAAVKRTDGDVRLVLGGVAPKPWRVTSSIEEDVASGGLDGETIGILAERAMLDAVAMTKNGYKIDVAQALLRRGIAWLGRTPENGSRKGAGSPGGER